MQYLACSTYPSNTSPSTPTCRDRPPWLARGARALRRTPRTACRPAGAPGARGSAAATRETPPPRRPAPTPALGAPGRPRPEPGTTPPAVAKKGSRVRPAWHHRLAAGQLESSEEPSGQLTAFSRSRRLAFFTDPSTNTYMHIHTPAPPTHHDVSDQRTQLGQATRCSLAQCAQRLATLAGATSRQPHAAGTGQAVDRGQVARAGVGRTDGPAHGKRRHP